MVLRLLEMVLQEKDNAKVGELLETCKVIEHRQIRLADGEVLVGILLDGEQSETVSDLLEKRYTGQEGNRMVMLPVEATLPRAQAKSETEAHGVPEEKTPSGPAARSCTRTSRKARN